MATSTRPPARSVTPSRQHAQLDALNAKALTGGGEERIKKQHEAGKLTARERIDLLLDPGSFVEIGRFVDAPLHRLRHGASRRSSATASSPGYGIVDGRKVFVFAQDFTVFGGSPERAPTRRRSAR